MTETRSLTRARAGDTLAVHGHHVGESTRLGEILEVLGRPDHIHFRVRWEDGRETIFFPGSDATVRVHERKKEVKTP